MLNYIEFFSVCCLW